LGTNCLQKKIFWNYLGFSSAQILKISYLKVIFGNVLVYYNCSKTTK